MKLLQGIAILVVLMTGCHEQPAVPSSPAPPTPSASSGASISVAAASDLKFAFEEVIAEFQRTHPGIAIEVTFGSSGNFYAQLSNKAPFDIFFSADRDYPRKLIEQGDALAETEFQYGIGHIGIWVRNDSPLDMDQQGVAVLQDSRVQKIAIANPRFAPYGRAAEAALKSLKIYDALHDRLVLGDNIAQTAQFVESGAAEAGIIAGSLANGSPLKGKGRFWPLPKDSYPVLQQAGVTLAWAKNPEACAELRTFVTSETGQAILRRYGFDTTTE